MIGINLQDPTGFNTRDFTGPASRDPFVTVQVVTAGGTADIFLHTPAQCDELMIAVAEAKRLLSPPVTEPEPVCPALSDDGALCTADHHPHQLPHRDRNDAEWADADPFGPEAYKSHDPGCVCWDCEDGRRAVAPEASRA